MLSKFLEITSILWSSGLDREDCGNEVAGVDSDNCAVLIQDDIVIAISILGLYFNVPPVKVDSAGELVAGAGLHYSEEDNQTFWKYSHGRVFQKTSAGRRNRGSRQRCLHRLWGSGGELREAIRRLFY